MPKCGSAACRKTLVPPLFQCSRCKAEAYCGKECQVPPQRAASNVGRLLHPPRAPQTTRARGCFH
jgi:hypothetical protein